VTGAWFAALVMLASCRPSPTPASDGRDSAAATVTAGADSIALERTQCFGTCPAYRVSITRDGLVSFVSRNPGEALTASARVSPADFARLVADAGPAGLGTLPGEIRQDSTLCPISRTDAPTVVTTLHANGVATRVARYTGCVERVGGPVPPALERLRVFEDRVDSVAGSARWVRPATRR
jgi:hypothetical protein